MKTKKTEKTTKTTKPDRLRLAVVLLGAILANEIVFRILWLPLAPLEPSSGEVGGVAYALSLMFVPAISVGVAVLVARWIEANLASAPRKTCIALIVVIIVAILLSHLQIQTSSALVEATPESMQQMGMEDDVGVGMP